MDTTYGIATLTSLAVGITEVFKRLGVPSRFAPLISLIVGVGFAFLALSTEPLIIRIITGAMCGLSASGLWDLSKKTILNKKSEIITNDQ